MLSIENISEIKTVYAATERDIHAGFSVKQLTSGHINQTYLLSNNGEKLILQKLNTQVFKNLESITQNIL